MEHVAMKLEPKKAHCQHLQKEHRLFRSLAGVPGVPEALWYGEVDDHRVLVMTMLGPSLEETVTLSGPLNVQTVRRVAVRLLDLIEALHVNGVLHNDVKPANFLAAADGCLDA